MLPEVATIKPRPWRSGTCWHRDHCLRFQLLGCAQARSIIIVNDWTFELSAEGYICGVDGLCPPRLSTPEMGRLEGVPLIPATVRLIAPFDANDRASFHSDTDHLSVDPIARMALLCLSPCSIASLYEHSDALLVGVDGDDRLAALVFRSIEFMPSEIGENTSGQ